MNKNILLTGTSGYVVTNIEKLLNSKGYNTKKVSVRSSNWKNIDFSTFDVVIHLAGLVHNNTKANLDEYMKINAILPEEIAKKSKNEGVKHFIFFSTMSVFGLDGSVTKDVIIDRNTKAHPNSLYGVSKLAAEGLLKDLEDENFKLAIVRPPMIYGKDAPGNFNRLIKLAKISPIFPNIKNSRSVIYIDNLSNYIEMIIRKELSGILHPQDSEYLDTISTVRKVKKYFKKPGVYPMLPNYLLKILDRVGIINKVFGNLIYNQNIDLLVKDFEEIDFDNALKKTLQD